MLRRLLESFGGDLEEAPFSRAMGIGSLLLSRPPRPRCPVCFRLPPLWAASSPRTNVTRSPLDFLARRYREQRGRACCALAQAFAQAYREDREPAAGCSDETMTRAISASRSACLAYPSEPFWVWVSRGHVTRFSKFRAGLFSFGSSRAAKNRFV